MPGRNIEKVYAADQYYHVYNRGVNKRKIFLDAEDYRYFEWLLERTLSPTQHKDRKGRAYKWLRESLDLNAYCLMPNHFHLLVYQREARVISQLMSTVATAYTLYFNSKYGRRGPLFENTYRAVLILKESQLMHITRYIHLNHRNFRHWPYSSYTDYLTAPRSWVEPSALLAQFSSAQAYRTFVVDYEAAKRERDRLKRDLADYIPS